MSDKKIVIIDDDPEICDAMSEILSEYDYQVFTALDTKTGYQLLLEQRPDLLILDIMMATMHEGLDFHRSGLCAGRFQQSIPLTPQRRHR